MPMNRRDILKGLGGSAALASGFAATEASAQQNYPSNPIRVIVPFPPGGSLDGAPRIVGLQIQTKHKWTIVIDNKPGASGQIGTVLGKNAPPDGHTLTAISGVTHGSACAIKRDLGYDPINDLVPIVLLADVPLALTVNTSLPVHSVPELIALLKSKPGELNYGSGGYGTQHHLAMAMFLDQAGLKQDAAQHIPAQGLAGALTDLVTGRVQMMISSIGAAWQHVSAGKLRPLAVTGTQRIKQQSDLPTMVELGYRDFEILAWSGLAAPVGTPEPVLARLNAIANEALAEPDVRKQLANFDFDARGGTAADFKAFVAREVARYRRLGESTGLIDAK